MGKTFLDMSLEGVVLCDMPSANHVWGAYLRSKGFERHIIPNSCPDCYTVRDFCDDHPKGAYILAISDHVVTVIDGMSRNRDGGDVYSNRRYSHHDGKDYMYERLGKMMKGASTEEREALEMALDMLKDM